MNPDIEALFNKSMQLDDLHFWMEVCATNKDAFLSFWVITNDPQQKHAWRALWVIEHAIKRNNKMLDLIFEDLYPLLIKTKNNSILRMGLKLAILRPIPNNDTSGKLLIKCERLLGNSKIPIATRVNSLQFIFELCKTEPDFTKELEALMSHISEHEQSAGMKSRIRLIRKELKKLSSL